MAKLLVCACGDCTHWEIIDADIVTEANAATMPAVGAIRCKTCGETHEAIIRVNVHENLTVVEREL